MEEYCQFRVAQLLRIAISVPHITEVLKLDTQEITSIPGIDPWFLGVINYRGRLLWILELSKLLKIPNTSLLNQYTIIILNTQINQQNRYLGCSVLDIEGMLILEESLVTELPNKVSPLAKKLFKGSIKQSNHSYAILEPNALFQVINPQTCQL